MDNNDGCKKDGAFATLNKLKLEGNKSARINSLKGTDSISSSLNSISDDYIKEEKQKVIDHLSEGSFSLRVWTLITGAITLYCLYYCITKDSSISTGRTVRSIFGDEVEITETVWSWYFAGLFLIIFGLIFVCNLYILIDSWSQIHDIKNMSNPTFIEKYMKSGR